jgi:hypothetical protein
MADEMGGLWIGPMPVGDFLDEFLARAPRRPPKTSKNLFSQLADQDTEKAMYGPFVSLPASCSCCTDVEKYVLDQPRYQRRLDTWLQDCRYFGTRRHELSRGQEDQARPIHVQRWS